jgi:hypothetical protein
MVDMHQKSELILGSLTTTDSAVLHVFRAQAHVVLIEVGSGEFYSCFTITPSRITRDLRQIGRVGRMFDQFFDSAPEYVKQ